MSSVTNLILTGFFLGENDPRTAAVLAINLGGGQGFVHINEAVPKYGNWSGAQLNKPPVVKWHRVLEHDVFVAAVNYLEFDEMVEQLRRIDFGDDRDSVRIMICGQEQSHFYVHTLDEVLAGNINYFSDPE